MGEQLSMLDTMFLELEQFDESAHMHIGAALIFDPLPGGGTPDIAEFRHYLRGRVGILPRFAQQLSGAHAGPLTWLTWEPAKEFDPDAHVHHATLPAPGGEAELHEWLGDFWSHRLDRHRPLWEMTLIDGLEEGRWALATKTHHCLVDGVGSLDIADVLLDASPEVRSPHSQQQPGGNEEATEHGNGHFWLSPGLVLRGARAGVGAALHPRQSLDRVRAAVELIVREEVIGAPRSSLNGPMSGTRNFATVRLDLAEVKATKTRLGGTVNDVVLALCAGGLRHLLLSRGDALPEHDLRAQVPVNIRSVDQEHALGNELTSLFVELPVTDADPIARYRRVVERAEQLKVGSQRVGGKTIVDLADMGPPLAGALLARSMFGGTRMFNLTITNVPGPRQRLYALGAPLVEVLPLVPLFAGHTVGIAVFTYAGQMVFGLNADRMAAPDIRTLAEGIERSFSELRPREAIRPRHRRAIGAAS
ncbi:MAG TPA: wax ester/triacylglycerol synthase family O-acyltransferase [Solirubrobacteraceae bacterium]|nr:wax ester/triacylglycerol synthase family O-acyltransferase [Solirubrobacteraceae bacterium]